VAISGLIELMAKKDLCRKGAPSAKGQTGIQDTMRAYDSSRKRLEKTSPKSIQDIPPISVASY
jgi:hypothetical protein